MRISSSLLRRFIFNYFTSISIFPSFCISISDAAGFRFGGRGIFYGVGFVGGAQEPRTPGAQRGELSGRSPPPPARQKMLKIFKRFFKKLQKIIILGDFSNKHISLP